MDEKNKAVIPFVKPVRVGNFKLWRTRVDMGKKTTIEAINISDLDGAWCVRVPQTFEMFGLLTIAYQWINGNDAAERERGEAYLRTMISNMFYVSSVSNGYYGQAVQMVSAIYADPALLTDKDKNKQLKKEVDSLKKKYLAWREEYDKRMAQNEPTEKEAEQEEIAEQAMNVLEKEDNAEGEK